MSPIEPESPSAPSAAADRFTPYQKRLFAFLSVATFFEGYDFFAITQVLPSIRKSFDLSPRDGTVLVAVVNFGTLLAFFLVRRADRWGRRRLLSLTILGYALFTALTGFAPNATVFALCQLVARVFLLAEWATSMVIAAEEFPASRRGTVIGVVSAAAGLGSVVCAGVVPLLLKTPLGWRSVYFLGLVPILLLAYARRGLRETARFEASTTAPPASLFEVIRGPYRGRILELGAIWFFTYLCTQNAVTFWKEFAIQERGLTDKQVGLVMAVAALASMPLVFFAGKLLDMMGRKAGSALIFGATSLGVFGGYTLHGLVPLMACMVLGIFGINAALTVLNTFMTELFPTELRATAASWSNNLIGRVGYVLSPLLVGAFVEELGWGAPLRATALFPLLALVLIFWRLPETARRELEETSRLKGSA